MIKPGTLSRGTLQLVDLISAGMKVIEENDPPLAQHLRRKYYNVFSKLDSISSDQELGSMRKDTSYLWYDLFNILNAWAPREYYFGSHPDDESDYGFWPISGAE